MVNANVCEKKGTNALLAQFKTGFDWFAEQEEDRGLHHQLLYFNDLIVRGCVQDRLMNISL